MKKTVQSITLIVILSITLLQINSCSKSATTTTTTTGKFTCLLGTENFSAPDAYLLNGAGGTLGVIAKDSKGRTFEISIFEKDFPVNTVIDVSYSTAIAYTNESAKTYIAKSGTMTITAYSKTSTGIVNNMKGNFSITGVSSGQEIVISEGVFDVSTK